MHGIQLEVLVGKAGARLNLKIALVTMYINPAPVFKNKCFVTLRHSVCNGK
jgi:hypothetical protein